VSCQNSRYLYASVPCLSYALWRWLLVLLSSVDVDGEAENVAGYSDSTWSSMACHHAAGFCLELALTSSVSSSYRPAVCLTLVGIIATLSVTARCFRVWLAAISSNFVSYSPRFNVRSLNSVVELERNDEWTNEQLNSVDVTLLCCSFCLIIIVFVARQRYRVFVPPFEGLRSNVHDSSMARRKARGRLPISANWTFFASYHGLGAMSRYWSKFRCLKEGWSIWTQISKERGVPTNDFLHQKTRVPGLSYGEKKLPKISTDWVGCTNVTDRQTDRQTKRR